MQKGRVFRLLFCVGSGEDVDTLLLQKENFDIHEAARLIVQGFTHDFISKRDS